MGLYYHKVRRMPGRSWHRGVGGLVHRNRKDAPQNRLDPTLEGWLLELYGRIPSAFENFHFMEIFPAKRGSELPEKHTAIRFYKKGIKSTFITAYDICQECDSVDEGQAPPQLLVCGAVPEKSK